MFMHVDNMTNETLIEENAKKLFINWEYSTNISSKNIPHSMFAIFCDPDLRDRVKQIIASNIL